MTVAYSTIKLPITPIIIKYHILFQITSPPLISFLIIPASLASWRFSRSTCLLHENDQNIHWEIWLFTEWDSKKCLASAKTECVWKFEIHWHLNYWRSEQVASTMQASYDFLGVPGLVQYRSIVEFQWVNPSHIFGSQDLKKNFSLCGNCSQFQWSRQVTLDKRVLVQFKQSEYYTPPLDNIY